MHTLDMLCADKSVMGFEMSSVRKLEIVSILPMEVITAIEIKSTGTYNRDWLCVACFLGGSVKADRIHIAPTFDSHVFSSRQANL
jgi:hypothetical protein